MLPFFKLAALLVKQLAKPVANNFKKQAAEHPLFRRGCIGFAQIYHRIEVSLQMKFLGHAARDIKRLDEERAVNMGAEILGEFFVFTVAGLALVAEYARSSNKEKAKDTELNRRFLALEMTVVELRDEVHRLQEDNVEIMKHTKFSTEAISQRERGSTFSNILLGPRTEDSLVDEVVKKGRAVVDFFSGLLERREEGGEEGRVGAEGEEKGRGGRVEGVAPPAVEAVAAATVVAAGMMPPVGEKK
jgi:optic atrophy 3 protein